MRNSLLLVFCGMASTSFAAGNWEDTFYAEGKINVVLTVVAIMFLGLAWKLFSLDRKVAKLEKEIKEK
ncbi:MAG: cell division protein FtsL [Luteibaculaceae bacterium]|jgi:cell division protein FtsL